MQDVRGNVTVQTQANMRASGNVLGSELLTIVFQHRGDANIASLGRDSPKNSCHTRILAKCFFNLLSICGG